MAAAAAGVRAGWEAPCAPGAAAGRAGPPALAGPGPNRWGVPRYLAAGPCRAPAGLMGVGPRAAPGPALPAPLLGRARKGLWTALPGPEGLHLRLRAGGGVPGSGRWSWSRSPGAGPGAGPGPAQFHVPGSRLLVPAPFPSRPLKPFVRPPCLSPPAGLTDLPRARAPLLKAKEVLRAFSGLLLSSHHTLLCLPGSSVSIPAGEKYCPRCSVLSRCLPCPTYCLLCGVRIQRWEGLHCQFAAYEKILLRNGVFSCFHV